MIRRSKIYSQKFNNQAQAKIDDFCKNSLFFMERAEKICKTVDANESNLRITKRLLELIGLLRNDINETKTNNIIGYYNTIRDIAGGLGRLAKLNNNFANRISPLSAEAETILKIIYPLVLKKQIREWVESIIIALLLALVIRTFVIQAFKIPTGSMRNTLLEGDAILVNKFIYGARLPHTEFAFPAVRPPKRGDIIVFRYPNDPKKDFIKRLVGLEGETVEIKNGTIYIDDKPLNDPLFNRTYYYNRGEYGELGKKNLVPKGAYFVLGDNSASSQDSRYWGFVPKKNILGMALLIYWPPQRIRIIR